MKLLLYVPTIILMFNSSLSHAKSGQRFSIAVSKIDDNKIEFWKPCNSEVSGLVVKDDIHQVHLGVGLVLKDFQCSNMPVKAFIDIPFKTSKKLMRLNLGYKPVRMRSNRISYFLNDTSKNKMDIEYLNGCKESPGMLLVKENLQGKLDISVITIQNKSNKTCTRVTNDIATRGFDWLKKIQRYTNRDYLRKDFYNLRIKKAEYSPKKGMIFDRHCNESPLSLVVRKTGVKSLQIGMLVASYPNVKCFSEKRTSKEKVKYSFLRFNHNMKISSLGERRLDSSWFVGEIKKLSGVDRKSLMVEYQRACESSNYFTYREEEGSALMGQLIDGSSCQKKSIIKRINYPLTLSKNFSSLKQLRLKGR